MCSVKKEKKSAQFRVWDKAPEGDIQHHAGQAEDSLCQSIQMFQHNTSMQWTDIGPQRAPCYAHVLCNKN